MDCPVGTFPPILESELEGLLIYKALSTKDPHQISDAACSKKDAKSKVACDTAKRQRLQ